MQQSAVDSRCKDASVKFQLVHVWNHVQESKFGWDNWTSRDRGLGCRERTVLEDVQSPAQRGSSGLGRLGVDKRDALHSGVGFCR